MTQIKLGQRRCRIYPHPYLASYSCHLRHKKHLSQDYPILLFLSKLKLFELNIIARDNFPIIILPITGTIINPQTQITAII